MTELVIAHRSSWVLPNCSIQVILKFTKKQLLYQNTSLINLLLLCLALIGIPYPIQISNSIPDKTPKISLHTASASVKTEIFLKAS